MLSVIESYFSVLMLFGASQAVLGIYLLLNEKQRPFSNNILALLVLSWGFSCYWFFAFIAQKPFFSVTVTTFIGPMLALTLFPPVFLYAKYMFRDYKKFQKSDHLHFLPIYIYLIFTFYLYVINDFSIEEMRNHELYKWRKIISAYLATLQGPFYFIKTNHLLKLREKSLKEEYSDIESRQLEWFKKINLSFAIVFVIGGISTLMQSTLINPYLLYMGYHAVIAISLFYITLIIYKYPSLFKINESILPLSQNVAVLNVQEEVVSQRKSSVLDENQETKEKTIIKKIEWVMHEEKLYKNPNLSLNDLAFAISETRNSISAALNNNLNKTFYHYINEWRIEECKVLLSDETMKHYSIEGIATQSGFKSMSVFYRFFKDIEKLTPAVYRKKFMKS